MSLRVSCLKSKRLHLRLRPAAESRIRSGHPWVFADSIRNQNREGVAGEVAIIFDHDDEFLALGLFDPSSPIRVRIIHRGKPVQIDADWWRERLIAARARRQGIWDGETNALRWINGESDQFPGLVLDQYAGTLVLKLYSVIWFQRIEEIVGLLREEFLPERMVLRLSRNIHEKAAALGFSDPAVLFGSEPDGPVIFRESGLLFEADVLKGQKTGFFLDQRENRRRVGGLSQGKDVLNAFSFSGGFSMYAALAGARSVTDVDISRHALESSRRNFALNGNRAAISRHLLIQADVFKWIEDDRAERYDVIVVDPPSLAKRESERSRSLKAYANLAGSGLKLLRSGGTIVCCSCSAHVGAAEFFQTIETVAERSGRKFKVLHRAREPADHPAAFAEAEYLKAIYLRFE